MTLLFIMTKVSLPMDKEFPEILRDYVLEQKQKNPSVNETAISKKMDIPPTTFNRLVNGHSKPAVKTLLKLIQFIPELQNSLPKEVMKIFKVTMEKSHSEYVGQTLEILLSDKYIFLCWMLAFSNTGVTEDEIKESFGQQGVTALKTLEQKDIISKTENSHYKVKEKNKYIIFSFRLIKAHLMFLAEQYKPDNRKSNYIHYLAESLNEEGKRKVMKAHQELHRKIRTIMDSEDNKGDIPVFSVACSDILSGQSSEEEV